MGMHDVSPWRQRRLNQIYLNNPTKVLTESKASAAIHNKAMGHEVSRTL
jgi:hypothetical protein